MDTSALALYRRGMDETPAETPVEDAKLTTPQAAELAGMKASSWRSRKQRGTVPPPDGQYDGRTPWWLESTVRAWMAARKPAGRPRKQG